MRWRTYCIFLMLVLFCAVVAFGDAENISNSSYASVDVGVTVNSAGEIGAVWIERFSDRSQLVYFSIRRNGQWSTPAAIPGQSGNNAYPCIAKGVNGGFVAAWHDLTLSCIRFSQYQDSWTTPITVSQNGGYQLSFPAITTTSNGRIAVGWMVGNPTQLQIFVNTFQNSWTGPVNVSNTEFSSKYCDLAGGPNGEIYLVFQNNLWINNTDFFATMICNDRGDGSWTQPQAIDNLNAWTFRPVVAVNQKNDILSCFYFLQGSSYWSVYRLNNGWQNPQNISDFGDHHDHDLYFSSACPYGDDGFLYIYRDVGYNIIYRIVRDGTVGDAVALTNSYSCYHPHIDFSFSVGAVAAWTEGNDVFVSIFEPLDATPPMPSSGILPPLNVAADYRNVVLTPPDLKSELILNRNLFTIQYFWKVSWTEDSSWKDWNMSLAVYRIYRKLKTSNTWAFLAEVDPSVLSYIDRNGVSQEDIYDYTVRGVDNLGNEFYAYNRISWSPNPVNAERQITVQSYNIYRKQREQSAGSFILWKTLDANATSCEDHSPEIRQQTQYDYALTAVSSEGKESIKTEAQKFTLSGRRANKP